MDHSRSFSLRRGPDVVSWLLPAKDLAVIRIVFYEDEESGEGEGETAGAEEGYVVPERRGSIQSSWTRARVGRLASRLL